MLNNISHLITPDVYRALYDMGHLDELVIVDANHSAQQVSAQVVFLPFGDSTQLLAEILKYFPLDEDEPFPVSVFSPDHADTEDPVAWASYQQAVDEQYPGVRLRLNKLGRREFNDRARRAYLTIRTLDTRLYSNILLRKGVILAPQA